MLTFERYLQSKLPIEKELRLLFDMEKKLVMFEIGCCEGEDTIKYSRLLPNGTIYAFEPLPKNFERTKENLARFKIQNAQVFNLALSDKKGSAEFHVSSGTPSNKPKTDWDYGNKSSSLLEPDKHMEITDFIKFAEKITVQTETIEGFCNDHQVNQIDFIHMDVQGAELMVMKGAGAMMGKIKAIWLEVANVSLYKNQPLAKEVEQFMKANGFTLVKNKTNKVAGDQLYVQTSYKKSLPFFKRIWL
jgi:FkbM family methyltransferase